MILMSRYLYKPDLNDKSMTDHIHEIVDTEVESEPDIVMLLA